MRITSFKIKILSLEIINKYCLYFASYLFAPKPTDLFKNNMGYCIKMHVINFASDYGPSFKQQIMIIRLLQTKVYVKSALKTERRRKGC